MTHKLCNLIDMLVFHLKYQTWLHKTPFLNWTTNKERKCEYKYNLRYFWYNSNKSRDILN